MEKFNLAEFRSIDLPSETELIKGWLGDKSIPIVSFVCTTFNHELYLKDTIRGFLLQETEFPFEILIHDDASTDGTASIVRYYSDLYPTIIRCTIQTENQYSRDRHYPLHSMFDKAKGKYVAICEGDDFWILRNKISRQVEILENNQNISLTYSKAIICSISDGEKLKNTTGKPLRGNNIYIRNLIPTLTVMFERKLLSDYYAYIGDAHREWLQSDYQLWLWLNLKGSLYFDDKVTSVYRVLESSASRPKQLADQYYFRLSSLSISHFFSKRNHSLVIQRKNLFSNHMLLFFWCVKRNMSEARKHKELALKASGLAQRIFITIFLNSLIIEFLIPVLIKIKAKIIK